MHFIFAAFAVALGIVCLVHIMSFTERTLFDSRGTVMIALCAAAAVVMAIVGAITWQETPAVAFLGVSFVKLFELLDVATDLCKTAIAVRTRRRP